MQRSAVSALYANEWRHVSPSVRLTWRPYGTEGEEDVDGIVAKVQSPEAESALAEGPQFDRTAISTTFIVFVASAELPRDIAEGDWLVDEAGVRFRVLSVRSARFGTQAICPVQRLEDADAD